MSSRRAGSWKYYRKRNVNEIICIQLDVLTEPMDMAER